MSGNFDWNNDGDADFALGDPYLGSGESGTLYVFYGPVTKDVGAGSADRIVAGTSSQYIGFDVAGADFDGDGKDDLVFLEGYDDIVYIDRGPTGTGTASASSLADITVDPGGTMTAMAFGDADGDGADDMLVGGGWSNSYAGKSYYIEGGSSSGAYTASTAATATFTGKVANDQAGDSLALCDFDGDGHADVAVAAPYADGAASESGVVYVFTYSYSGTKAVTTADATLNGTTASDNFGTGMHCIGDVNLDGNDDLGVTAIYADSGGTSSGTGYLFFGDLSGTVTASSADGIVKGDAASDNLYDVFSAGDVTDDGAPDTLFGARENDDGGSGAGEVWVFAGGGL